MTGIDSFLADALTNKIKQKLEKKELKKIERKLFLETGMSIKIAMANFEKFDACMKNIKMDHRQFELNCLNEICQTKILQDKVQIKLLANDLKNKVLKYFTNKETKEIMLTILEKDLTISEILKKSKTPRTSGYRKIEELIGKGMIIEKEKILSKSKKTSKFKCVFEEIDIKIKSSVFLINCYMLKQDFEKSSIMMVMDKHQFLLEE